MAGLSHRGNTSGPMARRCMAGFTLIEVMIVVVIIGILATVGYPQYQSYIMKSRRSEARHALLQIAAQEEQYFMDNRSYTNDFNNLHYPDADSVTTENGYYSITIDMPDAYSYTLRADPQGAQASDTGCTRFTLDNQGNKGATGTASNCW